VEASSLADLEEEKMRIGSLAAALATICLLSLVAIPLLSRPAGAKRVRSVLRARAIELVDGRRQVRAEIKVERGGEVVFRLRDEDGAIRVKLGGGREGSGLLLLNEATEPGVQALAGAERTSVTVQRGEQRNVLVP
jgi:hypothetical protein